jgi:AcrR family transcriptional regulator
MRYTPEHNQATRARIVDVAARLFREHGIAAVGLAKIMGEANLTVGTFYTHFKSKEDLIREALLRALQVREAELEGALSAGDLETVIREYLSVGNRDAPEARCPTEALAAEVARRPRATRKAFAERAARGLDIVALHLSARRGESVGRADAAAFMGLLGGTLQLARAATDVAESSAILEAGVRAALRLADGQAPTTDNDRHDAGCSAAPDDVEDSLVPSRAVRTKRKK